MTRFIVVPRTANSGRQVLHEVIDTDPKGGGRDAGHVKAERARIGSYADESFAHALAATLTGAAACLDAETKKRDEAEPF